MPCPVSGCPRLSLGAPGALVKAEAQSGACFIWCRLLALVRNKGRLAQLKNTGLWKCSCQMDLNCVSAALGAASEVQRLGGALCFYFSSFRELLQLT